MGGKFYNNYLADDLVIGAMHRPQFTYFDADELYIEGGWYDIRGVANKVVYINSQVKFKVGSAGSNSDSTNFSNAWHYIYIDYSAIPVSGILVAASFLNHTTAPTWSAAKGGWYGTAVGNLTVNDRCIFAIYGDGTPDITEWLHDDATVWWADSVETQAAVDIDLVYTDIGALRIPGFTTIGLISVLESANNAAYWRTNGQAGAVGHNIGSLSATQLTPVEVITDSGQIIEVKLTTDDAATFTCNTDGWRFSTGI